jgi:hypothetical protein
MKRTLIPVLALLLCGCRAVSNFVENHPKTVGITAALIVGSLAASAGGDSAKTSPEIAIPTNPCSNPAACQ